MVEEKGPPTNSAWWEDEPVPTRRTALPETKAKLPSVQELWTLVKAVLVSLVHTVVLHCGCELGAYMRHKDAPA